MSQDAFPLPHGSASSSESWYTDFFSELPNAFWRAVVPPEATEAEVDFLVRIGDLKPGARVLDVPCGSGRHSLALARRGYAVTGLDISPEAIDHASRSAAEQGLEVGFSNADMQSLPVGLHADAAICMGNSFGYLAHEGTRSLMSTLCEIIAPGGFLALDYGAVAEALLPNLHEEMPMQAGGIDVTARNVYDTVHSRLLTSFRFRRGDEEKCGTSVQHVYTSAECARLALDAGFRDVEMYANTDGAPFALASPRLLLIARR